MKFHILTKHPEKYKTLKKMLRSTGATVSAGTDVPEGATLILPDTEPNTALGEEQYVSILDSIKKATDVIEKCKVA